MASKKKYRFPSLKYPGGKSKVARKIIAKMPPHKKYVEPMAGAAHVFFRKPKAEQNVLNDVNREIIGFYAKSKGKHYCCRMTDTPKHFANLKNKKTKTACEFLESNKLSYGGKAIVSDASYAHDNKLPDKICVDGTKLNNVKLTSEDYKLTVKRHDSKDTLFYIDPPYVKANEKSCLYGEKRCEVTPSEIAEAIKKIKGKAIISYDDHPKVRAAFKGFHIATLEVPYDLAKSDNLQRSRRKKELLITNY